jgi:hypothetical protein
VDQTAGRVAHQWRLERVESLPQTTDWPPVLVTPCTCDRIIPVAVEAVHGEVFWRGPARLRLLADRVRCPACLLAAAAPQERQLLADRIDLGFDMKERSGLDPRLTAWLIGLNGFPGGYHGAALAVAAADWPADSPIPCIGGALREGSPLLPSRFVTLMLGIGLDGCPAQWEFRWSPWDSQSPVIGTSLLGLQHVQRLKDLDRLAGALRIAKRFAWENSGPKYDYALTLEEFNKRAPAEYWRFTDDNDRRPTQLDLAGLLATSYSTVRRRIADRKEAGLPWPPPRPKQPPAS